MSCKCQEEIKIIEETLSVLQNLFVRESLFIRGDVYIKGSILNHEGGVPNLGALPGNGDSCSTNNSEGATFTIGQFGSGCSTITQGEAVTSNSTVIVLDPEEVTFTVINNSPSAGVDIAFLTTIMGTVASNTRASVTVEDGMVNITPIS